MKIIVKKMPKMEIQKLETLCEKLSTNVESLFDEEVINLNRKILGVVHNEFPIMTTEQYFKVFIHTMALPNIIHKDSTYEDIKNISIVEMLNRDN